MSKYDTERFYWLQLKEDFFDEEAIDWLEEQPNGKEYSLFFLKLCLKSLRTNGLLIRKVGNMIVPYDHLRLGEITKTAPDTVLVALNLLIQIGLVERLEGGELYMTQVENMTGSQTKGAYQKQQQRAQDDIKILQSGGQSADNRRTIGGHLSATCLLPTPAETPKEDFSAEEPKKEEPKKQQKRFCPPSVEEVCSYCEERGNGIDPETFIDFYTMKGWRVGKEPMKDWKAAVRTWERRKTPPKSESQKPKEKPSYDIDDFAAAALERSYGPDFFKGGE